MEIFPFVLSNIKSGDRTESREVTGKMPQKPAVLPPLLEGED
jgi:hypothetical protein